MGFFQQFADALFHAFVDMNDPACGERPWETGRIQVVLCRSGMDKSERSVSSVPVCEYACVAAEAFLRPATLTLSKAKGKGSTRRATDRVGIAASGCPASAASVTSRKKPGLCR